MNHSSKNYRLGMSLAAALVVSTAFAVLPAEAQISKKEQLCVNSMEKSFAVVDKQVSRQIASCIKNHAKEKPLSPQPFIDTMHECVIDDPRGKVMIAQQRTGANFTRRCTPPLPGFGPTDVPRLNAAAKNTTQALARDIWTDDLDNTLLLERFNKPGAICQQRAWKAVTRCEQAKVKEFGRCTRQGLLGKPFPGLIDSATDLRNLCLGVGSSPQPDPKKKISRVCTDPKGIQKVIDRSCSNQSLTSLFPTCGTSTSAGTARCLDRKASCMACMALNASNGLNRDCELFDDGLVNNTCACGNGVLNAGEQCDDGNYQSGDGCTFDCRVEIG